MHWSWMGKNHGSTLADNACRLIEFPLQRNVWWIRASQRKNHVTSQAILINDNRTILRKNRILTNRIQEVARSPNWDVRISTYQDPTKFDSPNKNNLQVEQDSFQ